MKEREEEDKCNEVFPMGQIVKSKINIKDIQKKILHNKLYPNITE